MMPHTVEIEWFLRARCKTRTCSDDVEDAIRDLEAFVLTFVYGGFRPVPVEEPILPKQPNSQDIEARRKWLGAISAFHAGFAFFFSEKPEKIIAVSRMKLAQADRPEQYQHYVNMRHGSFAERAVRYPKIQELRKRLGYAAVAYDGNLRRLTLDRALRTCFNTSGVTTVLKEHLSAAFAKLVENEYVAIWHARLGLAAIGDVESIAPMKGLSMAIKDAPPFGAVSTPGWQAFYLAE